MVALLCSYLPSIPYMPADNDLQQIGLRLKRDQLQRLDQYCGAKGLDRTSAIRMAINQLIDGSGGSSATSGGAGVDQQARDALEALLRRVEDTEQELRVIRQQREAEQQAMQAAKDDFASKFAG